MQAVGFAIAACRVSAAVAAAVAVVEVAHILHHTLDMGSCVDSSRPDWRSAHYARSYILYAAGWRRGVCRWKDIGMREDCRTGGSAAVEGSALRWSWHAGRRRGSFRSRQQTDIVGKEYGRVKEGGPQNSNSSLVGRW